MILDLHCHSVRSDDGRAKVENYCQWIRKKELPIDGLVLTEHRQFDADSDYRGLEDRYGLLILKASEVEVDNGGSRPGEDDLSLREAERYGYGGFGGSDSHIVSRIGRCATEFPHPI